MKLNAVTEKKESMKLIMNSPKLRKPDSNKCQLPGNLPPQVIIDIESTLRISY